MFRWLIVAVLSMSWLCFSPTARADTTCVPGAQVACACAGGGSGIQVCDATADRLGPCDCAAAAAQSHGPARDQSLPAEPPARPRVKSKPMLRGGIAMVVIGAVSATIGTFVLSLAASEVIDDHAIKDDVARAFWVTSIIGGSLTVGGGAVMVVLGGSRTKSDGPPNASTNQALAVAPSLGLSFTF